MNHRDRQQDLFNSMGSMYSAVLFLGIQNANSVQPVVAIERTVFYREKATGMYSAFPYAFAQVIDYVFFLITHFINDVSFLKFPIFLLYRFLLRSHTSLNKQ